MNQDMKGNNGHDVLEVYKSLIKYFDTKGYLVNFPDGKLSCVEVSNSPKNNVEISFKADFKDAKENGRGYDVYGKLTLTLAKTDDTDPQFADQIFQDMKYFMEHFTVEIKDKKE